MSSGVKWHISYRLYLEFHLDTRSLYFVSVNSPAMLPHVDQQDVQSLLDGALSAPTRGSHQ